MRSKSLQDWLTEQGAQLTAWQDTEMVTLEGVVTPTALESGMIRAAVADRNERFTMSGTGLEVVTLVQGLVTGDVFKLAVEGAGAVTTAVDLKGRLVADMHVFHLADALIFDMERDCGRAFLAHARRHVIMEDAHFEDRSDSTARFLMIGYDAAEVIDRAGKFQTHPDKLGVYQATWGRLGIHDVAIQRVPDFGIPAFEVFGDAAQDGLLAKTLYRIGDGFVGGNTLEDLRIQTGYPRWGVELDKAIIPLEADMNYGVSYAKGCYLGQEIIARLDTRGVPAKMLRHLVFPDGHTPARGAIVEVDDNKVGEVRSAFRGVAMAYVKRGHNEPGATVFVDGQPAVLHRLPPWNDEASGDLGT